MGTNPDITDTHSAILSAASLIRSAKYLTAFTGAGISVESGIPLFRGPGGLWSKYDPRMLELDYFLAHPEKSWPILREIFYDHFGKAKPNRAHEVAGSLGNARPSENPHHAEHRHLALQCWQQRTSAYGASL